VCVCERERESLALTEFNAPCVSERVCVCVCVCYSRRCVGRRFGSSSVLALVDEGGT